MTHRAGEGFAVHADGRLNRVVAVVTLTLFSVFKTLYSLTQRHKDSHNELVTATRVGLSAAEGELN